MKIKNKIFRTVKSNFNPSTQFWAFLVLLLWIASVQHGNSQATLCSQFENVNFDLTVGQGTGITHTSQIGPIYTGNLFVQGDLIVDNGFTLKDNVVKIGQGVTIFAQQPNVPFVKYALVLDNSKLFACNGLWKGISLGNSANIQTKNGTEIEDAENAISGDDTNAKLNITQTTFNRNNIGINLEYSGVFIGFSNNKFTCTSPLNGTTDQIGFAGIKTLGVSITSNPINDASYNRFDGLLYGIYVEGYNTLINGRYFRFSNIEKDGVYLDEGRIYLDFSFFTDCGEKGINIDVCHLLDIRNSFFTVTTGINSPSYRYGVFIGGFALNSSVNLNMSFTADLQGATTPVTGVFLQGGNVGSGTKINIFQGTFSIHAFSGRGIEIRDAFPADSEIHIFGNNFNCSGGGASMSGLWSENGTMNNLNIYGNHFSPFPGESTCEGIRLIGAFNGSGNYVGDNTFNTIDGGFMDVNWMQGFTICSNSVQALGASSGFRFYDTNLDVDFTGNKIYATGEAVKISGLLGTQFHMGNEWHPVEYYAPCPTSPGLCLWTARSVVHASSPLGMASLNKFTVHTAQSVWNDATDEYDFFSPFYPENIAPSDPVFGFFETQSGSPASGCSSQFGPGGGSELDVRIADGSFQAPPESPSMDWITKSYLYKKLKDNPEMIGQYPSFSTFLSTHEATNIGEFYEVNKKVGEAFSASAPLLAESQQVMGAIDSLVLLLEGTDSLLEVAQSENEIDSLAQIKVGHLLQLSSNQSRYDSLHNAYKLERDATLSNALTLNNAITPTTQVESNEKKVLDIMIRTISVQDGALTEGQKNELLSIAQQCAETGGIAVLRALAMLPVTDRHQITPCIPVAVDTIAPLLSSAPTGQNLMAGNHSNVHSWLYPNPATASFFVDLPEKGRIEVIDMMGRSALVRDFQNEGSPVEIGHSLPSGMYIVNISTVSGKSFSEKLLIHND